MLQIAFVPQDDSLLPTLTVEECIRYSAILRCAQGQRGWQWLDGDSVGGWCRLAGPHPSLREPAMPASPDGCLLQAANPARRTSPLFPHRLPHASAGEVQAAVQAVVAELGLQHVARSRVGGRSGIRGISGGERRRWAGVCVRHVAPRRWRPRRAPGRMRTLAALRPRRSAACLRLCCDQKPLPRGRALPCLPGRVTIGMELVTAPAVLVLDEPTSGLDSHTALNLMRTLKQVRAPSQRPALRASSLDAGRGSEDQRATLPPGLPRPRPGPSQVAAGGRIVLLSFHQPSPAMFSLLDAAYLMARGRCIFAGPPDAAEIWFVRHGLPCPVGTAIAEHMLDSVSDPASLQQLLDAHDKGQPTGPADAATGDGAAHRHAPATAPANGAKTVRSDADSSGSAKLDSALGNGEGNGAACAAASAVESGDAAAAQGTAAGAALPRSLPSLSRELAVVFWRTLVDIVRNPALLLLHWCAWLGASRLVALAPCPPPCNAAGHHSSCSAWRLCRGAVRSSQRLGGTL